MKGRLHRIQIEGKSLKYNISSGEYMLDTFFDEGKYIENQQEEHPNFEIISIHIDEKFSFSGNITRPWQKGRKVRPRPKDIKMKPYLDILQEFEKETKKVAKVNGKPNKLGKSLGLKEEDKSDISKLKANVARERYELSCVPDFSKMSIAQAIKTFEENKSIDYDELTKMRDFCNLESEYRELSYVIYSPTIYHFNIKGLRPLAKITHKDTTFTTEKGIILNNLKQLIDYVDSWF